MKIHQNFFRALAVAGLSLSIATAQTTGTTGTNNTGSRTGDQTQSTGQSGTTGAGQTGSAGAGQTGTTGAGQTGTTGAGQTGTTGTDRGTTGTRSGSQSGTADHSGHVAGAAGNTAGAGQSMIGKTDQQFMTKAAQSGMMEVHLAQMAQQKAASDDVKEYARKLEQDHTKANDQLKQIAQERGVQLPSDMGQHQQQMAKFQNLSGEEFDRAYMKMQVQHHKKDIGEFRKHQNRSMDTDLKEFASSQLPVLQQHYEQAQQLSASTGTRARQADKSTSKGNNDRSGASTSDANVSGSSSTGNTGANSTGNTGANSTGNTGATSNTGREGQGSTKK